MSELTFTLTPNDPCQTEVTLSPGQLAYRTSTEHGDSTVTRVHNSAGEEIASLEWGVGFPDRVKLSDKPVVSMAEWMKKSHIPLKHHLEFSDDQGRKYRWKGLAPTEHLELYEEHDHYTSAICHFEPGDTPSNPQNANMSQLILTPRAAEIQDLVVISFLFLEKAKRQTQNHESKKPWSLSNIILSATLPQVR